MQCHDSRERKTGKIKKRRIFTRRRIATWISKTLAFKGQLLPSANQVNPPKNKLFGVVTRLKASLVEFSHMLH
jgi:hypothetical protein